MAIHLPPPNISGSQDWLSAFADKIICPSANQRFNIANYNPLSPEYPLDQSFASQHGISPNRAEWQSRQITSTAHPRKRQRPQNDVPVESSLSDVPHYARWTGGAHGFATVPPTRTPDAVQHWIREDVVMLDSRVARWGLRVVISTSYWDLFRPVESVWTMCRRMAK